MPANYTHRILGKEVLARLAPSTLDRIRENPLLFQLGLHGPDLLFYYKPLSRTSLGKLGHSLHHHTGREVLTVLLDAVDSLPAEKQDAALAYTLGFACHHLLDSICHPYVYQLIKAGKSDHCTIEFQMDYWLMEKNGASPLETDPVSHLAGMKDKDFAVIAYLYAALSKLDFPDAPLKSRPRQIASAYHSMQRLCHIFGSRHGIVRLFARIGLLVSGTYEKRKGMIFVKSADPAFFGCNEYMQKLLFDTAYEAPVLLEGICRRVVSARFDRTFEGRSVLSNHTVH